MSFTMAKTFSTTKAIIHHGKEEVDGYTIHGFAEAKMLFTAAKDVACHYEGYCSPRRRILLATMKRKLFEIPVSGSYTPSSERPGTGSYTPMVKVQKV